MCRCEGVSICITCAARDIGGTRTIALVYGFEVELAHGASIWEIEIWVLLMLEAVRWLGANTRVVEVAVRSFI